MSFLNKEKIYLFLILFATKTLSTQSMSTLNDTSETQMINKLRYELIYTSPFTEWWNEEQKNKFKNNPALLQITFSPQSIYVEHDQANETIHLCLDSNLINLQSLTNIFEIQKQIKKYYFILAHEGAHCAQGLLSRQLMTVPLLPEAIDNALKNEAPLPIIHIKSRSIIIETHLGKFLLKKRVPQRTVFMKKKKFKNLIALYHHNIAYYKELADHEQVTQASKASLALKNVALAIKKNGLSLALLAETDADRCALKSILGTTLLTDDEKIATLEQAQTYLSDVCYKDHRIHEEKYPRCEPLSKHHKESLCVHPPCQKRIALLEKAKTEIKMIQLTSIFSVS